jgi:hypothetical protein
VRVADVEAPGPQGPPDLGDPEGQLDELPDQEPSEENTLRMIILKEAFSAIPPTTPPHIRDNIAAELAWLGHGQEL